MNEIYLRRRSKLHIRPGSGGATVQQLATVQKEVEQLGFVLTEEVMARLGTLDPQDLTRTLHTLVKELQALVGAHREHKPLYPGFPAQVLALSEAELYLNALRHYITLRRMPADEAPERPPLLHDRLPRIVDLGSVQDFESICTQLAGSAVSLSKQDKDDLEWFVRQYRADVFRLLPAKLPFKENLAVVGAQLAMHVDDERTQHFLEAHCKTATDVLRLAVGMSGGDVSLTTPGKFAKFPRRHRKLLLGLIERCAAPTEDMLRWAERWKRLGERLHPGEHAKAFPKTAAAFEVVRNGLPFETFNSAVEQALHAGDLGRALKALESRPGEFARRLDMLARTCDDVETLLRRFTPLAPRVSTPVLLQVLAHFKARHEPGHLRVFFPKGEVAKVFATADRRPALDADGARHIASVCEQALLERFAKLPPLGRCYIDPALATYVVPLAQRSASKALRTLARGSRLPMPEAGFVRLFLWWKNGRSRVDVDLSAVLYGPEYNYMDSIAFYNLRGWGAHHSGDIVDAPKGAAEFIDLDLQLLRARGVRFVVMSLNSYSGQPYCDLPECFAGWMSRRNLNSGEAFEPKTVVDRIDLASDAQISLPLVLDLQQREVLWTDIALKEHPRFNNSVPNNLAGVSLMLRALHEMVKPNLHTLMELHARARGQVVSDRALAETIFGIDRESTVTPLDGDVIRADYL
jgi:hypothetical protein